MPAIVAPRNTSSDTSLADAGRCATSCAFAVDVGDKVAVPEAADIAEVVDVEELTVAIVAAILAPFIPSRTVSY